MSSIATLSSKGQLTVPVWAREQLGLTAGSKLHVRVDGDTILIERAGDLLDRLQGSLRGAYGDVDAYIRGERSSWRDL